MKKFFVPFVLLTLIAAVGCKKHNQDFQVIATPPSVEKKWVVTTVAGNGTASFVNGEALSATFHFPEDVAVDRNGNIYVTDALNFCIRKIVNGGVSNFAGGSSAGIENGIGTSAQFRNPYSVALDATGNLYTSDENDPRIRKISPAREVSVYAGTETMGFADGNAGMARFSLGNSITADALGNLYVADAMNSRIRKVSISGQVTTVAGSGVFGFNDGAAATARFATPGGIVVDAHGNLYVADRANFRIRKITPEGFVSTIAGSGIEGYRDGNVNEARFTIDIHDIVIDRQGNLYLADDNRIRKISPEGIVSTIAGSTPGFQDGEGSSARFNFPAGMGIDGSGNLYVADLNNNRIRKISFE
ncbi:MAG TPA: NHL repeat-containing protein [Chitinophagaceae bacterium]